MSTLKVNSIQNASGVEQYLCKAWVNFNGTGTVAIRASGNVSSITDNGTGDYTVNFTNAMVDANYSAVNDCGNAAGTQAGAYPAITMSTTQYRLRTVNEGTNSLTDLDWVLASFFR